MTESIFRLLVIALLALLVISVLGTGIFMTANDAGSICRWRFELSEYTKWQSNERESARTRGRLLSVDGSWPNCRCTVRYVRQDSRSPGIWRNDYGDPREVGCSLVADEFTESE